MRFQRRGWRSRCASPGAPREWRAPPRLPATILADLPRAATPAAAPMVHRVTARRQLVHTCTPNNNTALAGTHLWYTTRRQLGRSCGTQHGASWYTQLGHTT